MYSGDKQRRVRKRLRAAGLCVWCGQSAADAPGGGKRSLCEWHIREAARNQADGPGGSARRRSRRRLRAVAQAIRRLRSALRNDCIRCELPAQPGSNECARHLVDHARRARHYRRDRTRRSACVCDGCRRPAAPGRRMCPLHLRRATQSAIRRQRRRVHAGQCLRCSLPAAWGQMCVAHAIGRTVAREDRRCTRCDRTGHDRRTCDLWRAYRAMTEESA